MKTKGLAIFFILLIAIAGGLAFFLTEKKEQPAPNRADETISSTNQPVNEKKPIVQPEKIVSPETGEGKIETIQVVMLINGREYRTAMKPASSVYDLMSALKEQKKIDFKDYNYSGMGFFVTEINGIKNNSAGENWLYYVNGKLASIGVSYYKLKNNDTIEWKYEQKSF